MHVHKPLAYISTFARNKQKYVHCYDVHAKKQVYTHVRAQAQNHVHIYTCLLNIV